MSADSDAFQVVKSLPGLTAGEQQYLLTVTREEGFYGLGWGNPNAKTIAESEQVGIDPKAGVGSNNWGAEQGSGSAGSFPHIDHHADGSAYVGKYKKHKTPQEGAASVARILLKPNVKAAIARGDLREAVFAQHSNGYFELNPEVYLAGTPKVPGGVLRNYQILTKNLGWPVLLGIGPRPAPVEMIAATPLAGSPSSLLAVSSSGEHFNQYVVKKGDSLSKIAQLLSGNGANWTKIPPLNRDKKPSVTINIWPGEVLRVPEDWKHGKA